MSKVECWHPIETLRIGFNTQGDIGNIECGKCEDSWTVVKNDRLVTYIERMGEDLYCQVRNDGPHSVTSRAYTPSVWELNK